MSLLPVLSEGHPSAALLARRLEHERVANATKHWVRVTAACNNRCVFCLDVEAQDGRFLSWEHVTGEIARGRAEKAAERLILSGGEATIHPRFVDFVAFGRDQGYSRIQTVTNGRAFARREFFEAAVSAGLGEITFSLHGHTAELHDRLVGARGAWDELMRGMVRAVRDGRVVVNVDVVITQPNVAHLEEIVALCARVGVREFDLLHVIPQGAAFENRHALFYDPEAWRDSLRRVFRLARHPGFHLWTNRFPVSHLEGLEELIQDPHKMFDEVGGRRLQFRDYLDGGQPLDCRDPERCPHCFIEPFCSSLDRLLAGMARGSMDTWDVGPHLASAPPGQPLPGGATWVEARVDTLPSWPALPKGARLYLAMGELSHLGALLATAPPPADARWLRLRVSDPRQLEAVAPLFDPKLEIEVQLHRGTEAWLLDHPEVVALHAADWVYRGLPFATLDAAVQGAPDYPVLFRVLAARGPVRASDLPPCWCPGAVLEPTLKTLSHRWLHADGRLALEPLVERYVSSEYRVKSHRCGDCAASPHCDGAPIQSIRHRGLASLQPVSAAWEPGRPLPATRPIRLAFGDPPPLAGGAPRIPRMDGLPAVPVPSGDVRDGRRRS